MLKKHRPAKEGKEWTRIGEHWEYPATQVEIESDKVVHADCAYNRDLVREHLKKKGYARVCR